MSEFVWRGEINGDVCEFKIVTREITRAEQFLIWRDIEAMGLLGLAPDASNSAAIELNEKLAELVTARAIHAVYEKAGDEWKPVNGKSAVKLPVTPSALQSLPMSLANGWIASALKDNVSVYQVVNFPSASVLNTDSGSENPSGNPQ